MPPLARNARAHMAIATFATFRDSFGPLNRPQGSKG
jgi:hypothetical protein